MQIFDKVRSFFIYMQENDFKKYLMIFLTIIFLAVGFILYQYFSRISYLKKEIQRINASREEAQKILTKHQQVKKQKAIVAELLERGKVFKILDFFNSVVEKLNLSNKVKETKITVNGLENSATQEYEEIKLEVDLTSMNMKELTDLLNEIEENERVYIKGLEITHPKAIPAVDVNISIATLQLKAE
ncbi:MAG: hypothetical protein P4L22_04565 [Candidatus Babeliales bacterium]|nr:hypothetical protein [Candidatus Babeliales bacterium]